MSNQPAAAAAAPVLTPAEAKELRQSTIGAQIDNEKYLRAHPEVNVVLAEVTRQLLLRRPDEPVAYAEDFLAATDLHKLAKELALQKTGTL
jgi:hypothetical protein